MTLKEQLLALANGYATHEGISLVTLSSRVFNDGKKIPSLTEQGDLTTGRFERGMQWFADHWPSEAAWPADVPRPDAKLGTAAHPHTEGAHA